MQMERVSVDAEHALAEHALAERLLSLIEMHIGTPLTVEETASALFMSRASLQRFCKRTFGIGTAHLWERLRLEHGASLLALGKSVGECGQACGYSDPFQFSRAFKRVMGLPPKTFQQTQMKA